MRLLTAFILFAGTQSQAAIELYRVAKSLHSKKTIQLDITSKKGCGIIPKAQIKSVDHSTVRGGGNIYIIADDRATLRTGSMRNCMRTKDSLYIDVGIMQSKTPEDKSRLVLDPGNYTVWMNGAVKGQLKIRPTKFKFQPLRGKHEPTVGMVLYDARKEI